MCGVWIRVNFNFQRIFLCFTYFFFYFCEGNWCKKGVFPIYKLLYTKYNIYLYKGSENLPEIKGKTVHDITNYIGKHVVPNIPSIHKWMFNKFVCLYFNFFFLLLRFFFYHIFLIHSTHFLNMKIALSNYDNKFYFNYKMAAKHQSNRIGVCCVLNKKKHFIYITIFFFCLNICALFFS